jgi:hypothetical protein
MGVISTIGSEPSANLQGRRPRRPSRKSTFSQRERPSETESASLCAEGATEISPGLRGMSYPGSSFHKIILPLLAERGEGRGEESNQRTKSPFNFFCHSSPNTNSKTIFRSGNSKPNSVQVFSCASLLHSLKIFFL